jgi:hypothetical protein
MIDESTGLLKGWVKADTKQGIKYYPEGYIDFNNEFSEEDYLKEVERRTTKIESIPQSDDDPKLTRVRKQTGAVFHNINVDYPQIGSLLKDVSTAIAPIGEEFKSASLDPNQVGSGKAIVGTFLSTKDYLSQKSTRGAQIWGEKLNIDPVVSGLVGGLAFETLTDFGIGKVISKAPTLGDLFPPGHQLQPVGVNAGNPGLLSSAASSKLPSTAKPLQIASNMQSPGWQGSIKTLLKDKNYNQIKRLLDKSYHKNLPKSYQYMSLEDLSKNKGGWLDILIGKADETKEGLREYMSMKRKGASTSRLAGVQRKTYDKYTVNPLFDEKNIYDNPVRKAVAQTFNEVMGKEWHHIFGNKEAAEFMLSQVAQDPYIAVNLIHHLKRLNLPTGGTASNIALMKKTLHRKKGGFHSWYKKLGAEAKGKKKGPLEIGDFGQEISKAILSGETEIEEIFTILESYAKFNKFQRAKLKADFGATVVGEMGPVMKFIEGA